MAQLIRLTTGEEILCNGVGETDSTITVKDPVQLIPTQDGRITFIPYMGYCDIKELTIKQEHIMFIVEPSEGLTEKYESMVSDQPAIQAPSNKIIT